MLPERKEQLLVVDDEPNLRRVLAAQLARDGYDVLIAADGAEALATLRDNHIDVVITDLKMPNVDGMDLLRYAQQMDPHLPVVMITAHGTVDNAVEALKTGAFDYVTKPFDQAEVRAIVRKALETRRLAAGDALPTSVGAAASGEFGLVGHSAEVRSVVETLTRVVDDAGPLLIIGESGTGKELVARAVHERSARSDKPFVKVNCAAIAGDALSAELFGDVRGSSTKPGRLELASGGVVFLDEIGAIPATIQHVLCAVLQTGEFERFGGVGRLSLDARVVAASRQPLEELVDDGKFIPALAEVLGRTSVQLPPLRQRPDDLLPICEDIIARLNARFGKQVTTLSEPALECLRDQTWTGNIRELENVLEQAVLLCEGNALEVGDLQLERTSGVEEFPAAASGERGLRAQVKAITTRVERQLIQKALQQTQGNVTHAARLLKISRKGLQLKMKELGLRERDD